MTDSLWRDAPDEGESDEPALPEPPLHGEARTVLFAAIQRVYDNPDDAAALTAIRENAARLSLPHCDADLQLALFEIALRTEHRLEILSVLFEAGLDPGATDKNGQTALMLAATYRDFTGTRFLLPLSNARQKRHDSMAVDLAFDDYQRTFAGNETPESLQCLAALIEATPGAANAASLWLPSFAHNGHPVLLRAVLSSLDTGSASFWTPERSVALLATAATAAINSAECVDILLENGADPAARGLLGETTLTTVASFRHAIFTPGVLRLLELVDPNATNKAGRTALMTAALSSANHLLRGLLPFSDANAVDHEGDTALAIAARAPNVMAVGLLLPATDPAWRDAQGRSILEDRLSATMTMRRDQWECVDALSSTLSPQNAERLIRDLVSTLLPRTAALAESAVLAREAGLSPRATTVAGALNGERNDNGETPRSDAQSPDDSLAAPNSPSGVTGPADASHAFTAHSNAAAQTLTIPRPTAAKSKGRL